MGEIQFTHRICDQMKKYNVKVTAIVASMMQPAGIPDRYIAHTVFCGWLEFKGRETKITKRQAIFIREHNRCAPNTAYVVREPDRLEDHDGNLLDTFDGTGYGLLLLLDRRSHNANMGVPYA